MDARRVTETGHWADDGNQALDARELSLTTFNSKKFKQTIKDIFPEQSISRKISQSPPLKGLVQPLTPSCWLKVPLMERSNVTNPRSKRHFRSSR